MFNTNLNECRSEIRRCINENKSKLIEDVNSDIKIIEENDFKVISEDIEVLTKAKEELEKEIVDISDEKATITSLLKRYLV